MFFVRMPSPKVERQREKEEENTGKKQIALLATMIYDLESPHVACADTACAKCDQAVQDR